MTLRGKSICRAVQKYQADWYGKKSLHLIIPTFNLYENVFFFCTYIIQLHFIAFFSNRTSWGFACPHIPVPSWNLNGKYLLLICTPNTQKIIWTLDNLVYILLTGTWKKNLDTTCKELPRLTYAFDVFFCNISFIRLMNPRAKKGEAYVPTDVEHMANIITHGVRHATANIITHGVL